jgi:hypothetical protein
MKLGVASLFLIASARVALAAPSPPSPSPPPPPQMPASCIPKAATSSLARLTDHGVVLCAAEGDTCWAVDLTTGLWATTGTPVEPPPPPADAPIRTTWPTADFDAAGTSVKFCTAPGACTSVAVPPLEAGNPGGAIAIGTKLFAVWDHTAAQIYDVAAGKRVATIAGWPVTLG